MRAAQLSGALPRCFSYPHYNLYRPFVNPYTTIFWDYLESIYNSRKSLPTKDLRAAGRPRPS